MAVTKGRCLASQEIRALIEKGQLIVPKTEKQIQPASFDPIIGEDAFIIETETKGLFRPSAYETIYESLLRLPKRQRQKVSLVNGFEAKRGFTYLIPLEARVRLMETGIIKSSPKSSFGRLFKDTRLVADYNPTFDAIYPECCRNKEVKLWLCMQQLAFNTVLYSGLSLNQLRFFDGIDAKLTNDEAIKENNKNNILFRRDREGNLIPVDPRFTLDGMRLHLDLSGEYSDNIVALRARHNPTPIDLMRAGALEAEDYFEPIKPTVNGAGRKVITIRRGEYYLLASSEILKIPPQLSAELRGSSDMGMKGPLHFAGFIDPGFLGYIVFEVRPDEQSDIELADGMPVSTLDIFRNISPDKLYGGEIGSHYQEQTGPKPAKFFGPFDFKRAAREYQTLDKLALVQDPSRLLAHRKTKQGLEYLKREQVMPLIEDISQGFFHSRYDCERDPLVLQVIPYLVFFGPNKTVFTYIRATNIEDAGDPALFGKYTFGCGGHILKSDGPNFISSCLKRDVFADEIKIHGTYTPPELIGTMWAKDKPVDEDHFGLVFISRVDGKIESVKPGVTSLGLVPIPDLRTKDVYINGLETWSRRLAPHLGKLYQSIGKGVIVTR